MADSTDIIIDYLADRAPFADDAEKVLTICSDGATEGVLTANSVSDIFYVLLKSAGIEKAIESMRTLLDSLSVADIGKNDILKAMDVGISDLEDALIAVCAKRINADYIVTRNSKDFTDSQVPFIEPKELLGQFFPYVL